MKLLEVVECGDKLLAHLVVDEAGLDRAYA